MKKHGGVEGCVAQADPLINYLLAYQCYPTIIFVFFIILFFPVTKRVTPLCDSSFVAKEWIASKADHNLSNQSGENVTLQIEAKQEK